MTAVDEKPINTVQAVNRALDDAMAANSEVILLGEDVADPQAGGVLGITQGLSTKYGQSRVRSTPISEQAIIGAAIGAAIVGMRPVAEIMLMNFTAVAMDMIVNHAAKLRFMSGGQTHVPITIRTMTGAGFGNGGQHSDYLEAWFAHTAGIKVVAPSSPADAYGLLLSCIDDDDPCIFIENLPTLWMTGAGSPTRQAHSVGQSQYHPSWKGCHFHQLQPRSDCLRRGGRSTRRRGNRGRVARLAHRGPLRQSGRHRLCGKDRSRGHRARSSARFWRGGGDRCMHQRELARSVEA